MRKSLIQSQAGSVVEAEVAEEENRKRVEATEQKQRRAEVEAAQTEERPD